MPPEDGLCRLSAVQAADAIRAGTLSPVDLVEAVLDRIERLNPRLNAYCTVSADAARAAAAAAAAAVRRGEIVGPLHGVPVSVKDVIPTAGMRTTFGSLRHRDYVPAEDAAVVSRLRAAGAVVIGKTNTPEFGHKAVTDNLVFGPTRNPWDPARSAGGSSGGAAAAVAAGLAPLAVGTDSGGSIRAPACCCGVFGMKPTLGRVAAAPAFGGLETTSHIGPIARTVADAALMLRVMAGPDGRDRVAARRWHAPRTAARTAALWPTRLLVRQLGVCRRRPGGGGAREMRGRAIRGVRLLRRGSPSGVRVPPRRLSQRAAV